MTSTEKVDLAILFSQNIAETIYFIMSKNLRKYALFDNIRFFSKTKQLTVGKISDLYVTRRALSNTTLK
jgi:hypothetical protein